MMTTRSADHAPDYSPAEMQAVFLSRDLTDGELGAAGASAAIPMAAMLLARLRHAQPFHCWRDVRQSLSKTALEFNVG